MASRRKCSELSAAAVAAASCGSMESVELMSNCDSVMTSASTATRDLKNDLDTVQKTHDRISKLEVSLDVSFPVVRFAAS